MGIRDHKAFTFEVEYDYTQYADGTHGERIGYPMHEKSDKLIVAPSAEHAQVHLAKRFDAKVQHLSNVKITLKSAVPIFAVILEQIW